MKIGIVSDTHSNLYALQEVLKEMDKHNVELKVHCGDCVGYGPKPNETLELTLENFHYIIMGNHDYGVLDEESTLGFNPLAKEAIDWTRKKLTKENIDVIKNLGYGQKIDDILFIHGSPYQPFDYLDNIHSASQAFGSPLETFDFAFVGHTHLPMVWTNESGKVNFERPKFDSKGFFTKELKPQSIVNIGSVGQPRDGDPRASFAIFDTDTKVVEIIRVKYPVDQTVALMQRQGFSEKSWQRLIFGR